MRLKHRYVVAQLLLDPSLGEPEELSGRDVISAVREQLQLLYGDMGAGEFGGNTLLKFYDANTQMFVVTQIKQNSLVVRSLSVAGSSRTCLDKLCASLNRRRREKFSTHR